MLNKTDIDERVALALGLPTKRVAEITEAFIDELCNAVSQHRGFTLAGLGTLHARIERGGSNIQGTKSQDPMRIRLYFKKSRGLKDQIERHFGLKEMTAMSQDNKPEEMTKYAVEEGLNYDAMEKAATDGCPKCGSKVATHGRIVECPQCGTEPFEK